MTHITEARRYIANARRLLIEKAGKSGKFYADRKYVKMAGNTAWNGILEALDGTFDVQQSMKKPQQPDVKDYQQAVGKHSQAKLRIFLDAYDILRKSMGYDGILNINVVQTGLTEADELIDWCEQLR